MNVRLKGPRSTHARLGADVSAPHAPMPRKLIISSLPGAGETNPYIDLFYRALSPYGVALYPPPEIDLDWAAEHFQHIDALHFHWPEYIWRDYWEPPRTNPVRRFLRAHVPGAWRVFDSVERLWSIEELSPLRNQRNKWLRLTTFLKFVRMARRANVRIIWTLHNLESHEHWQFVDRIGFRRLAALADLIVCHSKHAKETCEKTYRPRCPVVVMPHGNYDGVYPPPRPRDVVLAELGLDPQLPVAACIGALRDYKGFDIACHAIRELHGTVQFLCAGAPHPDFHLERLQRLVAGTSGAVMVARRLTDQEFSDYTSASDIVLLPYRKITGSGALLAALTLGRSVVATDFPFFREVLGRSPHAGKLARACAAEDLAARIEELLAIPEEQRTKAARALAEQYSWPRVIEPVARGLSEIALAQQHTRGG